MTGASTVVRDAFTALRDALLRRLFERDQALEAALDAEETEPGVWQVRIGGGRTTDEELRA
jgi:hypothetical protein